MHKIILPIDTKSLYYNILNDNLKGHTCTVATPIKQGNSTNNDLMSIYKIPKQIDFEKYPDFIMELTKNSKSVVRVNNVFIFENLKINGERLEINSNFCFYTKEEIDSERKQFGRIKLHYPLTLKYDELDVDNRKVINAISDKMNGYAFIVESFEYDFTDDSLNFNVLIVGYSNIPYSKVFINNKGVGNKYSTLVKNYFDLYDAEIVSLRKLYGFEIDPSNFNEKMEEAKEKASKLVFDKLVSEETIDSGRVHGIRNISKDYPYSLFDFQYYKNNKIHYAIVFGTYSNIKYFNLTMFQNQFINIFNDVSVFIVTNLESKNNVYELTSKEIRNYLIQMDVVRFVER